MKRLTIVGLVILLLTFTLVGTVLAGSSGGGNSGISLHYPDNMEACEPTFDISTTGVPASFTVRYNIFQATNSGLVQIGSGTSQGNLDIDFTPPALEIGSSNTYAVFAAVYNANGLLKLKLSGKWNVTCS
jgi:hypothetical protein